MGIIQRQSFKYTLINLFGLVLGILSTLFIYPQIAGEFGFIRYLQELSLMIFPLMSLGMGYSSIRYYPQFKDEASGNHGLLGVAMMITLGAILMISLIGALLWPWLLGFTRENIEHKELLWAIFPFAAITTVSTVLYNYAQNQHRIALPSLLMDVLPKFLMPIILICYWKQYIEFKTALFLIILQMLTSLTGLAIFISTLGDLQPQDRLGIYTDGKTLETLFELRFLFYSYRSGIHLGNKVRCDIFRFHDFLCDYRCLCNHCLYGEYH